MLKRWFQQHIRQRTHQGDLRGGMGSKSKRRWGLARFGMRRIPNARGAEGWKGPVVVLFCLVVIAAGGLFGLAVTAMVVLYLLLARANDGVVRWRQRPIERYTAEITRTHTVIEEQLGLAAHEDALKAREIERQAREIERLRKELEGRSDA
jgi:hypothetical protein